MKKNFLVVGGTSGLGSAIADKLCLENNTATLIGRTNKKNLTKNQNFLSLDLENSSREEFLKLIEDYDGFQGVCFAQRYRSKDTIEDYVKEVKIMITSIAFFMDALINYNISRKDNTNFTKIIVVGSSYSSRVGKDQGWEYHTVKAAQLSLVRYFSIKSDGKFSINLISPATFIKKGAREYWESKQLFKKWNNFPTKHLLEVNEIADAIKTFLIEGNKYISGNNIFIDGGLFNLYPDQV